MRVRKYEIEATEDFGFYRLEDNFTPEIFDEIIQNVVVNDSIKVTKEDENNFYLELKNDEGYWEEFNIYVEEFITEQEYKTSIEYDERVGGGMFGYVYIVLNEEEDNKPEMISPISWEEFKDSGALWWINRQLQLFGMSIAYEYDEKGNIVKVYPIKNKFRGFSPDIETKNFKKLTKYLEENINTIKEDLNDD